jgi:rSAM/selenodomain-associated transferase 1
LFSSRVNIFLPKATLASDSAPSLPYACAVGVFARAPIAGQAKTRLIPRLGPEGAAQFQAALIADALRKLRPLSPRLSRYLFISGGHSTLFPSEGNVTIVRQRGAGLGARLAHAFRKLLGCHAAAVIIGTDSPLLPARLLRQACQELRACEAVLGPCPDGGYYLIGLRRFRPGMFAGVRWGTAHAFRDTLRCFLKQDMCCSILPPVADVDRPHDLLRLQRELRHNASARRLAPAAWRFLKNLR